MIQIIDLKAMYFSQEYSNPNLIYLKCSFKRMNSHLNIL